jgi:lysozyme
MSSFTTDKDKLMALLIALEGLELFVYKDIRGYQTIGVGRCIEKGIGKGITEQEAFVMLENDIAQAKRELPRIVPNFGALGAPRQAVLINMYHQLGATKLKRFGALLEALRIYDYDKVAEEMIDSLWFKQTPNRVKLLAQMMRSGLWPTETE